MIISVTDVIVGERIREEIGEEEILELMGSLMAYGQLQSIVVQVNGKGYKLIAGERRLVATKRLMNEGKVIKDLQLGQIRAELFDELTPRTQLMCEFDENMKRKDFTYIEKARFIRKFHETMEGEAIAAGGAWTAELTAIALRLSTGSISQYLRIEEAVKTDATVAKAVTLQAAVKRMKTAEGNRARQLEAREKTPEVITRAEQILKLGNAKELIKSIPDNSIDLINFDPPWGDDVAFKSNENWDGFDDTTEVSDDLIDALLPELFRVLKDNRFMIYWYRTWAYQDSCERLEKAGFNLKYSSKTPCIWYKPDKVSDQNRFPEKMLISAYETFILVRKGNPLLHTQGIQNVFATNRVPVAALIHPTEKPLDLCGAIIRLTSLPGELVLDPTAGSCAILHSALLHGRRAMGFELSTSIHERAVVRLADVLKDMVEVTK